MKKIKLIFIILGVVILAVACSKKNNETAVPTPPPAANSNFIKAKIDGVAYEAAANSIMADQNEIAWNVRSSNTAAGISGMDFSIMGQARVGTYNFNALNLATVGRLQYRNPDIFSSAICPTSSGTLTISAKNGKTIEGTFSFTGKKLLGCDNAAKSITDGSFKITFL